MNIRLAHPEDAEALLAIYGQYIDTSITFEYVLPSRAEFEGRIREFSRDYPYLVCEDGGKIVGYGYAHRAMERAAYQWNAELSVYLDRDSRAKGLGKKLCLLLMELLRLQGIRTVYSVVTSPNPRSERLQQALGFGVAGVFHSSGYKDGAWHDVIWFEKAIAPYDQSPAPLRSFRDIPAEQTEAIIQKYL